MYIRVCIRLNVEFGTLERLGIFGCSEPPIQLKKDIYLEWGTKLQIFWTLAQVISPEMLVLYASYSQTLLLTLCDVAI